MYCPPTDQRGVARPQNGGCDIGAFEYDTTPPSVTINQANGQADPASVLPVNFTAIFSEAIDTSTFTSADIFQNGSATGLTWSILDSGDHRTFTVSATASSLGVIAPIIPGGSVQDISLLSNSPSTSSDNSVSLGGNKIRVMNNSDSGAGSLRQALLDARSGRHHYV